MSNVRKSIQQAYWSAYQIMRNPIVVANLANQILGGTSPPTVQPLAPEVLTPSTVSMDQSGTEFGAALNAATPDVAPGLQTPLPMPPPNAASIMLPFFTSGPNLTVRLPAYIVEWDSTGVNPSTGPFAVVIQAQQLELDSNNNPVPDTNDPSGDKWDNIGSPVSPPSRLYTQQSPPFPAWSLDTSKDIINNPRGGYGFAFENTWKWDGSSNSDTVDVSVPLNGIVSLVRFTISAINPASSGYLWTAYSGVVPFAVSPSGLIQLKCIPLLILYQPPGDKSYV
ncbi:MAG: hypothetical protein ACYCOX_12880, partial [Acidobacteriaceae bacterium]